MFLTPQIVLPDGSPYAPPSAEDLRSDRPGGMVPAGYRRAVRQRLEANLIGRLRAASLPGGSVILTFIVKRDGYVVSDPQVTSDQGELIVTAAKAALASAQPFPPLPADAPETVRFRLEAEYAP